LTFRTFKSRQFSVVFQDLEPGLDADLDEVLEHLVTFRDGVGEELVFPLLELAALLKGALPQRLYGVALEELDQILLVRVLAENVLEQQGDWYVCHAFGVTSLPLGFIICVVNQLEEDFFVPHVKFGWHLVRAQFSEELLRLSSEVHIVPVVVLLVERVIELSLQGLSQQSYDLLEISFDVQWSRS
jgi:hypothetical protein